MLSLNNLSPKSQEDFKIKFSNRNALLAILLLILFFVYTINVVVDLMIYYDIFNYQYGNIFILISFIGFTLLGLLPTTLYIIKIKFPTNYKQISRQRGMDSKIIIKTYQIKLKKEKWIY